MSRTADISNLMLECEIPVIQQVRKALEITDRPRIIYIETEDLYTLKRIFMNENLRMGGKAPVLRDALEVNKENKKGGINDKLLFPDNILYINVHEYDNASRSGGFTEEIRSILDGYIKNLILPGEIPEIKERCYVLFGKLSDEDFEHYEAIRPQKITVPHLTQNDIDTLLDCYGFEAGEDERKYYRRELYDFDRETACRVFKSINSEICGGLNNKLGAMKKIKEFKRNICGSGKVLKPVFSPDISSDGGKMEFNAKGLDNLYAWLMLQYPGSDSTAQRVFKACSMLLLGVPGIGKTTFAKDIARYLNVDLYMLRIGDILDKYVGESEKKIKKILDKMAFLSPCVLMIDEIEKCLSGSNSRDSSSSSVNQHILQTILDFMDDKTHRVFTVATANSIDNLPAELFRSMRFDGKFMLLLPEKKACIDILEFHLKNNGYDAGESGTRAEAEYLFREIVENEEDPSWFLSGSDLCKAAIDVCRLYNSSDNIDENNRTLHEPHEFYKTVKPFNSYSVYAKNRASVRKYAEMYYSLLKQSLPRAGIGKMESSDSSGIKSWKFSSEKVLTYEMLPEILSEKQLEEDDGEKTYDSSMNRIMIKEIRSVAKSKGDI